MTIIVKQIRNDRVNPFIKLPFRLYKNDPNWVPPLISEAKDMLDVKKNVFLSRCNHALFIAYRGTQPVARILAGYNPSTSENAGAPQGFFSLFEAADEQCGLAILEAAEKYCKSIGAVRMTGPLSPTDGEEERALLVEGFGFPPALYTVYNPEWYQDVFKKYGLMKTYDLLAFKVMVKDVPVERFRRVVKFAEQRFGFNAYSFDLKNMESELKDIHQIVSESATDDWESVPTWETIEQAAGALKTMADPELVYIVRRNDGRPLALVVCIPNFNEVLIHMRGRLLPFGIFKFLYWKDKIKSVRVMMQFCVKDYERTGAVSSAYLALMEKVMEKGYIWGDASTIGEKNPKSWRPVVSAGGKVYRRYRYFEKEI